MGNIYRQESGKTMNLKSKMATLLDKEPTEKNVETLKRLGFKDSEIDNGAMLVASVYEKALKGNASALKFIAFLIEEEKAEDEQPNRFNDLIKEMRSKA